MEVLNGNVLLKIFKKFEVDTGLITSIEYAIVFSIGLTNFPGKLPIYHNQMLSFLCSQEVRIDSSAASRSKETHVFPAWVGSLQHWLEPGLDRL